MVADLRFMEVAFRQVLQAPDATIRDVFFPTTCLISIMRSLEDGSEIEVGMAGREGIASVNTILGVDQSFGTSICQGAGSAFAMTFGALQKHLAGIPSFHRIALRYVAAFQHAQAQMVACNRLHTVNQRCARWLLMMADRIEALNFPVTQEFLAQMLGVRRAGVNASVAFLEKAGAIQYERGNVTISDRAALEGAACECYGVIRDQYQGLLGG